MDRAPGCERETWLPRVAVSRLFDGPLMSSQRVDEGGAGAGGLRKSCRCNVQFVPTVNGDV